MFRGFNSISLDVKGRLAIPARYRQELDQCCDRQLIITVDRDSCLLLYPLPEWEIIERKLIKLPSLNKKAKMLQRLLIGHATECEMDGQGRISIPVKLREFAKLEKRIALIGQLNKFEIWDEDLWNSGREIWHEEVGLDDLEELGPELGSLSF